MRGAEGHPEATERTWDPRDESGGRAAYLGVGAPSARGEGRAIRGTRGRVREAGEKRIERSPPPLPGLGSLGLRGDQRRRSL